ncbi:cysteine desulfurase-like protein [Azospirillum picis]|uniref:Cysteine desulfurase family protein (TIGR01976 family) n=1 Tax=Azospirillum picis TaxID=488438 RepID=A0ABU0MML1_9PROT|nr:cysteine desulfurase-like protein [Azospirillum picis]MBP2300510.1 cysteine desulfurase family protein (TIGR01976 family) [Azospirillum picis]MDQ0534479.1 cysteine desulfurase family protein (TIGR01976 family) [Azospirillum picis]
MSNVSSSPLDLSFVRSQFPALAGDWTFMDNAGGSQTLARVADRIRDYLLTSNVQLGASYGVSRRSGARVADAHAQVAELIGAARPDEVVMGPSTTALLYTLSAAMAGGIQPGDEIVVTDCDHEANIGPWRKLEERGAVIRTWAVRPDSLELSLDDLDRLLNGRTRLVCVTHASNILGTINPVADIARLVHRHGARLLVDAVAYAPHRAVDVAGWDVDYYVFSFYKVYGPHFAVLYGKHEHLAALPSLNHYFIDRSVIPYKLQPGNVNYELAVGCTGIVDYLAELGERCGAAGSRRARIEAAFDAIAAHEEALAERLLSYLRRRKDVRIVGHSAADRGLRVPTISFVVDGRRSDEVVSAVDSAMIGIRFGDFYARRLIEKLGLAAVNGVIRVSLVHYNTLDEVDRLVEALGRAMPQGR